MRGLAIPIFYFQPSGMNGVRLRLKMQGIVGGLKGGEAGSKMAFLPKIGIIVPVFIPDLSIQKRVFDSPEAPK